MAGATRPPDDNPFLVCVELRVQWRRVLVSPYSYLLVDGEELINALSTTGIALRNRSLLTLVACAVSLGVGVQAGAEDTRDVKGREFRGSATVRLSDELPDLLGTFTKRHGVDYEFQRLVGTDSDLISLAERDPMVVVNTVRPVGYFYLRGPVVLLDEVVKTRATTGRATGETLLVAGTEVLLSDGVKIALGARLVLGDRVESGLVLNAGDTDILLQGAPHELATLLAPGEALIVLSEDGPSAAACGSSCSVACTSGYFACCSCTSNCCRCRCIRNGTSSVCDSGGSGSTSCSSALLAP